MTPTLEHIDHRILVPATDAAPRNMGADLFVLRDGRLLLGVSRWLGGAHDDDASEVFGLVSGDGGDTWSAPFDIVKPSGDVHSVRMPNFLRLRDGRLACFCRHRVSVQDTWTGMIVCEDETALGETAGPGLWSEPRRISPPAPGRHILLNNRVVRLEKGSWKGRILLPLASPWPWDRRDGKSADVRAWVLRSDDEGETWSPSTTLLAGPARGLMEPYITEQVDGRLRMWMRTQVSCQYESTSDDGGATWSVAEPGPLVSPESPVAVARHAGSGLLAIVWNHNRRGRHTADRTPICVAFSEDEGASWFGEQRLDPTPSSDNDACSFSYPSIDFVGDRAFVTYYENRDRRISLVLRRFDCRFA